MCSEEMDGQSSDAGEAAAILGYHPDHMRRLHRSGRIAATQFNRVWTIDRQEAERIQAIQGPSGRLQRSVPEKANQ